MLPSEWAPVSAEMGEDLCNLMLINVHPEHVSPAALKKVNTTLVVGREPKAAFEEFGKLAEVSIPNVPEADLERGEALLWTLNEQRVMKLEMQPPREEHYRHRRKYAEGRLEDERMFHFRAPEKRLNLIAHNLNMFLQIAEGVDGDTWQFHLRRGDYSNWLRNAIKDSEVAGEVAAAEKDEQLADGESRKRIREAILKKYTAPA